MTPDLDSPLTKSYRACERRARHSRSNFYCAFLSLPRDMFREMCVLYAFMRHTDDLGDAPGLDTDERKQEIARWRADLVSALAGEPVASEILPALADVVRRHQIPVGYLFDVICGVEGDLSPREFQTFPELEHYCYQVAGAVGLCCLYIWGFRGDAATVRQQGIACGTAFQLTNILRDLREDAEAGRVYLPLEDFQRFSYSPEQLRQGVRSPEFRDFMAFQAARAWDHYTKALPLLDNVHSHGRRVLSSFMEIYSRLLREMERRDFDVLSTATRIRLSRSRKGLITLRCLLGFEGNTSVIRHRAGNRFPG